MSHTINVFGNDYPNFLHLVREQFDDDHRKYITPVDNKKKRRNSVCVYPSLLRSSNDILTRTEEEELSIQCNNYYQIVIRVGGVDKL